MNTHIEIKVNGKPIKQYSKDGRTYIEAREGTEYAISIHNNEYRRKLAVITVDGLNVITGSPQDDSIGQGYIVPSRGVVNIKGFRKDDETVGAFKFCNKGKSYCNERNLEGNNGVIGIRLYDEKVCQFSSIVCTSSIPDNTKWPCIPDNNKWPYRSIDMSFTASDCKMAINNNCYASSVPDFSMGTTWGKKVDDRVTYVSFEHEDTPTNEFIIFYDTRKNLEKIGVSFKDETQIVFPKAFGNYAKPPKGWKGK